MRIAPRRLVVLLLLWLASLGGCGSPPPASTAPSLPPVSYVNLTADWPYPFSQAVRVADFVYLSGQIGMKMENGAPKLVEGGIKAETKQALENIKSVLAKAGSSMDRVVTCSVMMADMNEWPAMNEVYATYFPGPKPARSAWGANGLVLGARVEIGCMATALPYGWAQQR